MKGFRKLVITIGLALMVIVAAGADSPPSGSIAVVAKRFAFVPDHISVKKGQPVTLSLRSADVKHGLAIKELGVKTEIPKGRETIVTFTPQQAGSFEGKCDHFCGSGHGDMKFTVVVTE